MTTEKTLAIVNESSPISGKRETKVLDIYKRRGNGRSVLGGKRLGSQPSERKKKILGDLDKWVGGDPPAVEDGSADATPDRARSQCPKLGESDHKRDTPQSPFSSSPRKKSIHRTTIKISKKSPTKGSVNGNPTDLQSPRKWTSTPVKRSSVKAASPKSLCTNTNHLPRSPQQSIISPGALSTDATDGEPTYGGEAEPRGALQEEKFDSSSTPFSSPSPLLSDDNDDENRRSSRTSRRYDIPESPSIQQRTAHLQNNSITPQVGSERVINNKSIPVAPFVLETLDMVRDEPVVAKLPHAVHITKEASSGTQQMSSHCLTGQFYNSSIGSGEQEPIVSPSKSNPSNSEASATSQNSEKKDHAQEWNAETSRGLKESSTVAELIGKFSRNHFFKPDWELDEAWGLSPRSRRRRAGPRLISDEIQNENDGTPFGLELLQGQESNHNTSHSRNTHGSGTATYEEASVEDFEDIKDSFQGDVGQENAQLKSSVASYSLETPSAHGGSYSKNVFQESNTSMLVLHDSSLRNPSVQMNTVVLDLGDMERGPFFQGRIQKAQVNSDLEKVMEQTKQAKQSSKSRRKTEKMLRGFLDTLAKVNSEDQVESGPAVKTLTVEEVSDIVTHINLCEQTNTPIRWDLIGDIIFPDGIQEETDDDFSCSSREGKNPRSKGKLTSSGSKSTFAQGTKSSTSKCTDSSSGEALTASEDDLLESFRAQYQLSEDEMKDVIAHLNLCEETGMPIRWDLIHCMICPEDDLADLAEEDAGDCKSEVTDGFEHESKASWFSINPEFDDCASSITFALEGDAVKIGKKSKLHKSIKAPSLVEEI